MKCLAQDLRFSFRLLRKSRAFTITAVLTLAIAIGSNAVVFSVMDALILHPLSVPHANSFYAIQHANEASSYESYPDYLDLRDRNHSFDDLAAYNITEAALDTGKNPSRVWFDEVSGNYFDVLGIRPYVGRFFHASDEHGANSAPYIVLSYEYWHANFQDDRGVVGRTVQVNKHPFTIIGIAPPKFHGTLVFFNPDFFVPFVNQEQVDGENYLDARNRPTIFMAMGHLKEGVTKAQAIADLNSVGSWLAKTYPKHVGPKEFTLARPGLYGDYLGRPVRAFVAGLMLLTGLILLAACANLGTLFAAHAADRSKEVALRLAIGSSQARVLRQLFTEAVMVSLVGGVFGLWGSAELLRALSTWQPFSRYPEGHLALNLGPSVFLFAFLLAVFSGVLFGAVPISQVLRTTAYEIVKAPPAQTTGWRIAGRDTLLVVQIAICAVLVTSSFVAVRGLARSLHANFGFDPHNATLAEAGLTMAGYSVDQIPAMQKRLIDAVQAIPGVESVGLTNAVPLADDVIALRVFTDKTTDLRPANAAASASTFTVSPEYFLAAGTPLVAGRTFTWHDDQDAPRIAIVNQQFARKIFGSVSNAIGGYFKTPDGNRIEIVGVAGQGKYRGLTEDPKPAMFLPIMQRPSSQTLLVVRSHNGLQQLAPAIRNALRGLDGGLTVFIRSWDQDLDTALFGPRMATLSLGVLGILAAMLAVTGIFGTAAYSVSKRLREIGVRIALGARRTQVLQSALGRALKVLALGSIAGLLLGILASRVLAFVVYQATPRDPLVLAGVVLAMALVGLVASWIPARRALSINPLMLLRE
ncbi:MAG: ABC transporter substrate-binding protein [Candidatus Angelobacter sp. Gp1-AA117]|nr:MAG: ABC transporter substrate-binding protein [Candidatus Angelobacter sp. Gp1-AA117]